MGLSVADQAVVNLLYKSTKIWKEFTTGGIVLI